jgi:hypothetical protein
MEPLKSKRQYSHSNQLFLTQNKQLMKKIIIAIISILLTTNALAQNSQTEYDTCSALEAQQGEWLYTQGQDTIRIYFRYHRCYDPEFNTLSDNLWGWHEYKKGNQVIQSNYQHRFMPLTYNMNDMDISKCSIWLRFNPIDDAPNNLRGHMGSITDSEFDNNTHAVITTITNTNGVIKMNWRQYYEERGGGDFNSKPFTMTLPLTFILTKQ